MSTTTGNGVQTENLSAVRQIPLVTSTLSYLYGTIRWTITITLIVFPTRLTPGSSVAMEGQELRQICQDVGTLRAHLTALQKEGELQDVWCHVGYVLDFLLFRIYLLLISFYALVIIYMWCIWVAQT